MRNSDRIYLSKLASGPDSEFFGLENVNDFDFVCGNEIDQFMDEDINDLEDMFWKK
ncbi:MAG: hypothetical protein WBB70_05655 [Desulfobacterales bacterium]